MAHEVDTPEAHPWNTEFEWHTPDGPFRTCSSDQAQQFDEQGFVVIPDVVDATLLADIVAIVDGIEAGTESFLETLEDGRIFIAEAGAITFTTHLVTQHQLLRDLAAHPILAGLCSDLVGPDVRLYWDQAVYKKPSKPRRFPWHQDNGYTYVEPQQYLTCWLALNDATTENGCPWVAPGFHKRGTLKHTYVDPLGWECLQECSTMVPAEVAAGGVVVFSSLTPHLTGPNTTPHDRKAYILQYAPFGATSLQGDATNGPPTGRALCDDPHRQFPVVVDGKFVDPPRLTP